MISIQFVSFTCKNFCEKDDYLATRPIDVVVGPLRIIETIRESGDKEYIIRSGCTAYYKCQYPNCRYSKASREGLN